MVRIFLIVLLALNSVTLAGVYLLKRRTDYMANAYPQKTYDVFFDTLFQEGRVDDLEYEFGLMRSALAKGQGFFSPRPNRIFQQREGFADVEFEVFSRHGDQWTVEIRSSEDDAPVASLQSNKALKLRTGMYKACFVKNVPREDCVKFGVGDVYVVAGQSNAESRSEEGVSSKNKAVTVSRKFEILDPSDRPVHVSAAWVFAGDDLSRKSGRPISFINVAEGATATYRWRPDQNLFRRLDKAVQEYQPKAILWHQGESDCLEGLSENESYKNMASMIGAIKKISNVPWMVAHVSNLDIKNCPVRLAQSKIIAAGLALDGPDTDPLEKTNGHFATPAQLQKHGEAWAAALDRHFYKRPQ